MTNTTSDEAIYGEEELLPWELQPGETAEQYRAFCDYRDMGKASLQALTHRYRGYAVKDPPTRRLRTLAEWSRDWRWVERRKAYVQFEDEIRREAAARASREMGDRQARDAAQLQVAAVKLLHLLGGYDEETGEFLFREDAEYRFQDVVRLFKTGFEAERIARGEAAQVIEERGRRRDVSQLTDDELDALIGDEE